MDGETKLPIDKEALEFLMEDIFDASKQREKLVAKQEVLEEFVTQVKGDIDALDNKIKAKKEALLATMQTNDIKTFNLKEEVEGGRDIIASVLTRETNNFNDAEILKLIVDRNEYQPCIKKSILKSELNKLLKQDEAMAMNLTSKGFIGKTTTSYVVVTDEENFNKMQEHISESKKRK